ncbi:cilia- and flagella-associated protein 161-like isoform X1 [Clavelina lepadiformis]|uniref:Cilia- and flagella-associated protein 161 n=1 Tax=Clavelina lepadiformis TaxID=159417 RepID=A0ABP0FDT1_CLALP
MSVRTYNPSVRVGNWNEDICLEEDLLKDFLGKKERGELLVQKTHNLLENILKKKELSVSTDGFVHFGDTVMIVNPGQEDIPHSLQQVEPPRPPTSLSINMDEYKMHLAQQVEAPCSLSASRILNPCARNSFVITSIDGSENGSPLRFGQPFAISTTSGYAGNLKVFSDHARFNLSAKKSRQQIIQLIDELNYLTTWQALAFHPQQRLEYEGLPVPANTKLILRHNKTGEKLIIHDKYMVRTPFGREYEVSAHTVLDSHKAEKDNNHWVLVTGNPSDDETTHFDRPIPEPSGVPKTEEAKPQPANPEVTEAKPSTS